MREIKAPPIQKPLISDIELFAKAYFNIELTRHQLRVIDAIANGKMHTLRISRRMGLATANKIVRAYISEGLKPDGRVRLPMYHLPTREKIKGVTQEGKVLAMIKRPGGAFNFELSRIALKYTSVISSLRADGHEIVCDPTYNRNGKRTNTFKYRLGGH